MTKPITKSSLMHALALNALFIPGSGNIVLGQRLLGISIAGITLLLVFLCLAAYCSSYFHAALGIPADTRMLSRIVQASSLAFKERKVLIAGCSAIIGLIWVFGIVDILYRMHRHSD
ncbi:MAG: hypothetical protein WC683_08945 [bacterium]